jgi:flagellar hook assembly protein FlgD
MSVGHVARIFEEKGISTVTVLSKAFEHLANQMKIPRVVITKNYVGRTIGLPNDKVSQTYTIEKALTLFEDAKNPNTVIEI